MDGRGLKQYQRWKDEAQFLRASNLHLELELRVLRPRAYRDGQRIGLLEEQVEKLLSENQLLKQRVEELTLAAQTQCQAPGSLPDIKPSVKARRRKKPGRKAGHPAALRPTPQTIDTHQEVPLPRDSAGRPSCPRCNACLLEMQEHQRIVEDIVPARVVVTCYHTRSGWCPCCRKRVESRALEQPPAANLPHGQLGINALASAVLLRIVHRLPFRQVSRVLADLPGITVSSGAIARQVQRIAGWLEDDYEQLLVSVRAAPRVHADETGWRTDGKNGWLWALTTPTQTLYHVNPSRGGAVIEKLLGKAFGGTLVSDFYSAYSKLDCKKQKCLVHLLRELIETAEKSPTFAAGDFFRKCRHLVKEMLLLKGRWSELGDQQYSSRACRLENRMDQLASVDHGEAHARRIGKRLRKFRKELTAFLWDKELEGTNNAVERAIRPMVVARKISGGSRSDNGAAAFAKLASLLRTAGQQGKQLLGTIKSLLTAAWSAENPAVLPDSSTAR